MVAKLLRCKGDNFPLQTDVNEETMKLRNGFTTSQQTGSILIRKPERKLQAVSLTLEPFSENTIDFNFNSQEPHTYFILTFFN